MGSASEKFLGDLCEHSFLSLWCFRNPYSDRHLDARKIGKELCDLLVVFGDDVLIFSDKSCEYPANAEKREALDWSRWYRRAIKKSCEQLHGAKRWIRQHPNRLFSDPACQIPLPAIMPPADRMRVHRIAVALGARDRCRKFFGGGSGSLMTWSTLEAGELQPFTLGPETCNSGSFVHVFDEVTLPIVMRERDTIADFCRYLRKKEELFASTMVISPGEEALLSHFLRTIDATGYHGFIPAGEEPPDGITFEEGLYEDLASLPEYRHAQLANKPSYAWDKLIEYFTRLFRAGDIPAMSLGDFERGLRAMAATTRVERRPLGRLLSKLHDQPVGATYHTAWYSQSDPDMAYIGILLPVKNLSEDAYVEFRKNYAINYARALKITEPRLKRALVFATNAMKGRHSEVLALINLEPWTAEIEAQTREFIQYFNVGKAKPSFERIEEFPSKEPFHDSREARRRRQQAARLAMRKSSAGDNGIRDSAAAAEAKEANIEGPTP